LARAGPHHHTTAGSGGGAENGATADAVDRHIVVVISLARQRRAWKTYGVVLVGRLVKSDIGVVEMIGHYLQYRVLSSEESIFRRRAWRTVLMSRLSGSFRSTVGRQRRVDGGACAAARYGCAAVLPLFFLLALCASGACVFVLLFACPKLLAARVRITAQYKDETWLLTNARWRYDAACGHQTSLSWV